MAKGIRDYVKSKFDYDVDALPAYIDEQNPTILQELQANSLFMDKCTIMSGVKGSEKIKLMSSSVTLQDANACGWNAEGGVVFTDKTATNYRLKVQEEYCNEDLNGFWTQMYNKLGANVQDMENPFADVIIATKTAQLKKAVQDAILKGDIFSPDDQLNKFDGLIKKWDSDPSLMMAFPGVNAFETLKNVANLITPDMYANNLQVEVIADRLLMQECIDYIFNNKDYNQILDYVRLADGEISFVLPTTLVTFTSVAQLAGTGKAYLVPFEYVIIPVDGDSDVEGFEMKYNENDEKLRLGVKFRVGVEYVLPQYFGRLV